MSSCPALLVLLALVSLIAGVPLQREVVKRNSPSHQTVEVPETSFFEESPDHVRPNVSSSGPVTSTRPPLGHQTTLVPEKVDKDHNDIPEIRQSMRALSLKPDEALKKRPAAGRKGSKRGKKSNAYLLHHLGMAKIRSPSINHHRKRLASQSRKTHHQKSNGDSKMFVIKLPPNPYYYAHHDLNGVDASDAQPRSVSNLPVDFKSNGKPSRVYHWNIPVLKKMVARKAGSSAKAAIFADSDIFNIDKQVTWNETGDDKQVYRKATYYGPKKQSKHTFRKYFAGNGKPHSFYVMEKSKKPASVHRLLT